MSTAGSIHLVLILAFVAVCLIWYLADIGRGWPRR